MSEKFREYQKKEISEGIAEYKKGAAEFAGEQPEYDDGDSGWELSRPEVTKSESILNFKAGIEAAKEMMEKLKGSFVGAKYIYNYQGGYFESKIALLEEVDEEKILKKLAYERDWSPLYDDTLAFSGRNTGDGYEMTYSLGGKEICSSNFSRNTDAEAFCFVAGKPVRSQEYYAFRKEVREMLYKNYQQRGAEETYRRELPPEVKAKVEKMRFDHKTEQVLKNGKIMPAGVIRLKHKYNSSHFDNFSSGGGYGSVYAFDLAAWREGKRVEKKIAMSDPNRAMIESNTVLICKGGDAIGHEGRSWEEIYICE